MKNFYKMFMLFLLLFIGQNAWCAVVASGELDNGITWKVENNGTGGVYSLTIEGSGDMPDFNVRNPCPWDSYLSNVYSVNISSDITKIGTGAFFGSAITSIKIPENCKEIGGKAFYRSNLKAVYIPANVETIGKDAFDYCSNLRLFHYDNSVTSKTVVNLTGISYSGKLIEKSTGTNGSYAKYPSNWERYTHGDQCKGGAWVAECGTKLFFYAEESGAIVNLAASGRVPAAVTNSPDYHPWRVNCYKYTSLEINKNVASIAGNELVGYENSDVTKSGFTSMKTITIENGSGNNYFYLDRYGALYDKEQTKLYLYPAKNTTTEIEIPATVTTIGSGAFYGAKKLKKITFLGTVKTFGQHAFGEASSLNYMYFTTTTAPSSYNAATFSGVANEGTVVAEANTDAFRTFTSTIGSNWTFDGESYGPVTAYILNRRLIITGKGAYNTYYANASWYPDRNEITKIIVGENITDIGGNAFTECTNVKEITLNNSGTIENGAFKNLKNLTRVNIGTGALVIDAWFDLYPSTKKSLPFEGCSKLEYINIEDFASFNNIKGLKYLMDSQYGTKAAKTLLVKGVEHSSTSTLVIPEGITKINVDFKYFKNVTRVKIPSTVEKIEGCFSEDTYLTEITIPSTVKDISHAAFKNCTSLKTATLNNSGTIEGYVFSGCTALTRVNIGTGALVFKGVYYNETVGFRTPFEGCSNLEYINIEDFASFNNIKGLYYLMDDSYGTKAVKSLLVKGVEHSSTSTLVIPEGITNIIVDFKYFKNVTRVKIPSTVETLGSCFAGDKYLKEITLPSTVTSVASDAFKDCTSLETVTLNNKGSIGDSAFRNCKSLGCVNIGKGLTTIDWTAGDLTDLYGDKARFPFYGCPNLSIVNVEDVNSLFTIKGIKMLTDSKYGTNACKTLMVNDAPFDSEDILHIPENVGYFSPSALKYFQNVKKISLSPNVESVSDFKDYSYLTDIILPRSVKYLEDNAFYGCSSLKRIVCLASEAPSTTAKIASNPSKITLRVPDLCSSVYKSANYWKEFNIEEGSFTRMAGTLTLKTLAKRDLNGSVSDKIVYWSSSNTDYVTVDNGVISASDFKYDGTIAPFRGAYITALSEDADTYSFSVRVQPREVVLTDGNDYKNTVDFEAEKISYTRNYKENVVEKWQAFYVPFDIEVTDELLEDYDFAKLYMVSYYDANDNGEIEDDEPLRMTFNKFSAGRVLRANMPYFIRVKSAGTKTIEVTNTTLKAAANGSVRCSTTEHEYTLVGIYEPTYMRGKYGMAANGGFTYITSARTKLGANRWYMEVKSLTEDGAEFENYARPIEIFVDGEEAETTGITTVEDKAPASQNEKIFTLDGRQVTNTDNLPSGIYIINGKKVFKK